MSHTGTNIEKSIGTIQCPECGHLAIFDRMNCMVCGALMHPEQHPDLVESSEVDNIDG